MPSAEAYPHMNRPLESIDPGQYRCIVADPPWNERGGGQSKRGADRYYPCLSADKIIDVMLGAECWKPANSAHLWLWVTNNFLNDGLRVLDALGFRYVTNLAWCKPSFGLGFYLRGKHELCLFGARGQCMPPSSRSLPSIIHAPKGEHSAKPDEAFDIIERVSPGPRLEMFARASRGGWDTWGNEIGAVPRQERLLA